MNWVPELLSPAGSLEKLKLAVLYGADAVYLGLQKFGLRSAAENFTLDELEEGVLFAHKYGAKVFVVLNAYLHDAELADLPISLKYLEERKVDAVIVSDLGVVKSVLNHSSIPVHLSTQASCLNSMSAKVWKDMGVSRIVFGREISIKDAAKIKSKVDIEVEMFVHGSMCMAYSGNCVISNYTQGRDSNRGGCAHSCRFQYKLDIPNSAGTKAESSYFMSSKDLNTLANLELFIEAGIDSLKVEGRMKNHLYVSTISHAYRLALDEYKAHGSINTINKSYLTGELEKLSNRSYTEASIVEPAGTDSVLRDRDKLDSKYSIAGKLIYKKDDTAFFLCKNPFSLEDQLEVIPFNDQSFLLPKSEIRDLKGDLVQKTKPNKIYQIQLSPDMATQILPWNIVRSSL